MYCTLCRSAAALLDAGDPAATAQCALAKKIATDYGLFFRRFTILRHIFTLF